MESRNKIEVSNLLLPVNSIDLILNFSQPIKYIANGNREKKTEEFHINGLRNKSVNIIQTGKIYIMGVSFQPYGLFNVFDIPVSEFTNEIVEINLIAKEFTEKLREKIEKSLIETEKVEILEEEMKGKTIICLIDLFIIQKSYQ